MSAIVRLDERRTSSANVFYVRNTKGWGISIELDSSNFASLYSGLFKYFVSYLLSDFTERIVGVRLIITKWKIMGVIF
jgi:hypothetical protein